jgi:hypothetical protein
LLPQLISRPGEAGDEGHAPKDSNGLQRRRDSTALPPEQDFPVALIGLHGLLAITTLVLVLLTALGVGDY